MKTSLKIAAMAALVVASLPGAAQAVVGTYNWDPNLSGGSAQGGTGTWNITNGNWANSSSADVTWGGSSYSAIFAGTTAGAVTMGTAETATNVAFNTSGYTITGSGVSTLTVVGNMSVVSGGSATINATLGSPTINFLGGGNLTLGAALSLGNTGSINVQNGNLILGGALTTGNSATFNIAAGSLVISQTSGTVNFNNGGAINGNLVIANSGIRVNFNTLTNASSAAAYNGSGSIQVQSPFVDISNTSGSYGGAIGAGIQLNSLGQSFTKTDVTQTVLAYPASNSFVVGIGATKNGSASENLIINGVIFGNSDVVLGTNSPAAGQGGGAGVMQLNASNTYTGTTFITGNGADSGKGGSVILGVSNALPITTDLVFGYPLNVPSNNPGLDLNGNNQQIGSLSMPLSISGTATTQSAYFITNNAANTLTTLTVSGNTTPGNPFGGRILDHTKSSGGTLALVKGGAGTLWLSGSNTYSGGTTVTGGVLKLGSANALGVGGLTLTGGSVDMASFSTTLPSLSGSGGVVTNSGSADSTLTINLQSAATPSFGGALTDGIAHKLALIIGGSGTLTLSGSSNYSGGTTLNGGMLVVANSAGSALGLGNLILNGGTLAGDPGTIAGSVIAGSGAHVIAPGGGLGGIGTLILGGSLSLNGNSTLDFDISGGSADLLQIGGALSISSPVALDINASGADANSYTLATYAPSAGVVSGDFSPNGIPDGYTLSVTSTQLSLVAVPEPSTIALALVGAAVAIAGCVRRRAAPK